MCGQQEDSSLWTGKQAHTDTECARTLDMDFTASITMRNKFWLFIATQSIILFLLQQPEQTETGYIPWLKNGVINVEMGGGGTKLNPKVSFGIKRIGMNS